MKVGQAVVLGLIGLAMVSTGYSTGGCGDQPAQACDLDHDGYVSILDLTLMAQLYGQEVGTSTATSTSTDTATPSATATPSPTGTSTSTSTPIPSSTSTPSAQANSVDLIVSDNYSHPNDGCVNVPSGYDWSHSAVTRSWYPRGSQMDGWAMVEWDCAHDSGPGGQFEVADFRLYAYLSDGSWRLIDSGIYGSQINDPSFGSAIYGDAGAGPIFQPPPHGKAIQFYQPRTSIPASIQGMYATYRARLVSDDGAWLLLNVGADWATIGDMGISRMKRLTAQWQYFDLVAGISETALRANAPPL